MWWLCIETSQSNSVSPEPFGPRAQSPTVKRAKRLWGRECVDIWSFSSPEPLGLICNRPVAAPRFPTTWPRNDGLWGREWQVCLTCATANLVNRAGLGNRKTNVHLCGERLICNNLCLHTVQNTFHKVFYIPYISAPIAPQLIRSLTSTYCILAGGSGKYSFWVNKVEGSC